MVRKPRSPLRGPWGGWEAGSRCLWPQTYKSKRGASAGRGAAGLVGEAGPFLLGTPGGARLGREGTWGGGPKGSGEAPGLEGTGGAPPRADPAGGGPGAGPRDPGRAGGTAGARRCGVGLDVGDLRPAGTLCTCSQESSTGGGMGVLTVVVLMSPIMLSASFSAWYIRSISSRR